MLRFDKAAYISVFFQFILSLRLSNLLRGSNCLLLEITKTISILYYNGIEFIILSYTLWVVSLAR